MTSRPLVTMLRLPPGLLPRETIREFLRIVFEEFRWFAPIRYGDLENVVLPGRAGVDAMLGYYEQWSHLMVGALTDRDFIFIGPSKVDAQYPYTGSISWNTREKSASKPAWRSAHEDQVQQLMKMLGSPYAYVALDEDIHGKTRRLVPSKIGSSQVLTVRDYSEGLAGLYWRNFFGPPFVRMFGERLQALPPEHRRDLGDGIVLVEPYPLPGDAETEAGKARERALIEQLGPECFYDHERHVLPTRRPELPAPSAWK